MSAPQEVNFADLLLNDKNLNSLLLSAKKDKTRLIEHLLFHIEDKKELLAKVKILSLGKKLKKVAKLNIEWGLCEDIVANIFASFDHTKVAVPYDLIKKLSINSSFYRKVCNWYFQNTEFKGETSDRIIAYILRYINKQDMGDGALACARNDVTSAVSLNECKMNIDINTVQISVLNEYDESIQAQLKMLASKPVDFEMVNRCLEVIKILLDRNKTKSVKLFKKLHYIDSVQKMNLKTGKIGPVMKLYFKKVHPINTKLLFKDFLMNLEEEKDFIKYTNHVCSVLCKFEAKFEWREFLRVLAKNPNITQLDLIDFRLVPSGELYRSVYKQTSIRRYRNLLKNLINNDIDIKLLEKYQGRFGKNVKLVDYSSLIGKRIEKLKAMDL